MFKTGILIEKTDLGKWNITVCVDPVRMIAAFNQNANSALAMVMRYRTDEYLWLEVNQPELLKELAQEAALVL